MRNRDCNIVTIALLNFCLQLNYLHAYDPCPRYARELSDSQGKFLYCATVTANATAFKVCTSCVEKFNDVQAIYQSFSKDCPNYYGQNIVAPIPILLNGISNLWQKAFCADCFVDNKILEFDNKTKQFKDCAYKYPKNLCYSCILLYDDLNTFYTNIDRCNKGKVCYDIHFTMNTTRMLWSANCQHEANLFYFILTTALISFVPVIFYTVNIFLTKRLERRHELLYNRDAEERESDITAPYLQAKQPQTVET